MPVTLPPATIRALREPVLTAAAFTPMKFTPADTKAWFANHFLRFVSSDFPKHQFTLRFYRQVMHTFGHIAHYDAAGYWAEFFTSTTGKIDFIEQAVHHPCYGDPTHTFSDVEREIARRLRHVGLLDLYRARGQADREAAERAEFARLKARFGQLPAPALAPVQASVPAASRSGRRPAPVEQLAFAIG